MSSQAVRIQIGAYQQEILLLVLLACLPNHEAGLTRYQSQLHLQIGLESFQMLFWSVDLALSVVEQLVCSFLNLDVGMSRTKVS